MGERRKNVDFFRMCLNLNDYQFKTSRYTSTYMNPMVITNKKTYNRYTKTKKKGTQTFH